MLPQGITLQLLWSEKTPPHGLLGSNTEHPWSRLAKWWERGENVQSELLFPKKRTRINGSHQRWAWKQVCTGSGKSWDEGRGRGET